jgi:uncharacterized membrane protein YeaQ/YmgE (transglycosylase-associated protein family)
MGVIGWIIFGFVVGLIARALMPGPQPMGIIATTLLGIAGALLGGWVGHAFGWYQVDEGAGFIAATIGSIVLLLLYSMAFRRRSLSGHVRDIDRHRDAA